ncbi:MAG: glycosyltransferase family 4 protein [Planctomycetes bacterium]|nr:glycosyltransferase family 4 protein [Planctomycetota bacterium]MCB9911154.1 glycosyltransferase family 4 protein [Planctomycetota bacterium]MCB9911531.1 glycosyltransferase family 4 protein [Planctomycetota bacterium]
MRVLMLGWEFPPHISGGLGTACQGICEGLAASEVEVLFVVPKAFGDEWAPRTRVVGANQVGWNEEASVGPKSRTSVRRAQLQLDPQVGWNHALGAEVLATGAPAAREHAQPTSFVHSYQIDSPLRPYLTAREYSTWVGEADGHPVEVDLPPGSAPPFPQQRDTAGWLEWTEALAEEARLQAAPSTWVHHEFAGGYGGDLFDEVARYARVVAHLAAQESFDVVHGHDWMTAPAAIAAARAAGKPLVMHAHALERDRSGTAGDVRVQALERLGLVHADRVVCVSHYTANIVHHDYGVPRSRLRVVHNAVTQKEQRAEWHTRRLVKDPIVLFLGRVTMQKGPEYFLEAAALVVKIRPDVTFVLSGSGDMLPRMIEYSAKLGLARHVHFTGFLRGKDVERMYSMADLYVMPSVSEPFGIAPLEAMALDVPVILSSQSGVSEVVTHALKVDFWDTRELANKILAVLEYAPLRDDLIQSGREEVRRMRWEARGSLLRRVYEELMP